MKKHIEYSLKNAFTEANVYTENVENPIAPFFEIRCLESAVAKKIGGLYEFEEKYEIKYFHKKTEETVSCNEEVTEIALKMTEILEIMEFKGIKIRGIQMKYRIEDNVLQFFLNCKKRMKKEENFSYIENLSEKIERRK